MSKRILYILLFLLTFSLFQTDYTFAALPTAPGGGGCPATCGTTSNICSTNTSCNSSTGQCVANKGCSLIIPPASYSCRGASYKEYSATCTSPTPTSPNISSSVSFYDQSNYGSQIPNNVKPYINDQVLAEVNASNVGNISAVLQIKDNLNSQTSSQNITNISYQGNGKYGFTFNTNPVDSPSSDEIYTYSVKFTASNSVGTVSSGTSSFNMSYPHVYPFHCNTPTSGRLLASNLAGAKDIVLFNNDASNGCLASSDFSSGSSVGQHIIAPSGVLNASAYNSDAKDSLLFFPTGTVQDPQCYSGGDSIDESSQTVLVSGLTSGNIWLVHWCYVNSNVYNTIDMNSVRVLPIVTGTPGGAADMEIDTLNNGSPKYFWYTTQITGTYRLNWGNTTTPNTIYYLYNKWRESGFSTNAGSINVSSCTISNNTCLFENGSSMNGFYSNGTKTLNTSSTNGQTYISIIHNSNKVRSVESFNSTGQSGEGASKIFDTGINGSGFSIPGLVFLQKDGNQDTWHLDGMTATPDNKYILAVSGGGRVVFVYYNTNTTSPQYIGIVPIVGSPDPATNGGFDGVEIDQNWQLYLSNETQGIWSANAHDIINAAWQNGQAAHIENGQSYLTPMNWVQDQEYVGNPNDENWDDIAPLSGTGSANNSYPNYYLTRQGEVYSNGGYSISTLNSQNDLNNAYFGTYGVFSGTSGNTFLHSINSTGSLYAWEFQNYSSAIDNSSTSPEYGYQGLFSILNANPKNKFVTYVPSNYDTNTSACSTTSPCGLIDASTNLNSTSSSSQNIVYTYNGNIVVDSSSTNYSGINANGIIFVNGDVYVKTNPINSFNKNNNNHLLIISSGNTYIIPSTYPGTTTSGSIQTQHANIGIITDKNLTVESYNTFPNFVEPMQLNGLFIDYGKGNNPGDTSTNLNFQIGYLSKWNPSVKMNYDPGIVNEFSKFFMGNNTEAEIGL